MEQNKLLLHFTEEPKLQMASDDTEVTLTTEAEYIPHISLS